VISVYRLSSARYPATSGAGAAKYGGRWNRIGTQAIYAAQSVSLAALEVLVHYSILPRDFVLTEIQIPDARRVQSLKQDAFPIGWDSETVISATQDIGESWVREGRSAILSVPSSIIPSERNFVLNPAHPAFQKVSFLPPVPFQFDRRLK